jgi:hypothetical protein
MSKGYAFDDATGDDYKYFASLRLPIYDSPEFDAAREKSPGFFMPGDDKVGDLRSDQKPYINDPNYPFWLYGRPRDIWFGVRFSF